MTALGQLTAAGQRDPVYWYNDHCARFLITHQLKEDGIAVLCRCYFRGQDHNCERIVPWEAIDSDQLELAYFEVIARMERWVQKCSTSTPI